MRIRHELGVAMPPFPGLGSCPLPCAHTVVHWHSAMRPNLRPCRWVLHSSSAPHLDGPKGAEALGDKNVILPKLLFADIQGPEGPHHENHLLGRAPGQDCGAAIIPMQQFPGPPT